MRRPPLPLLALLFPALLAAQSPIHFTGRALPFTQFNDETPRRYAPETMSGGVAAFDFDNDGHLDLFFPNGAPLKTLAKSDAAHSNRLLKGDGKGNFTDVTAQAGLTGLGYDIGAAVGDFDNDGCRDLFVAGVQRNTLYRNNCKGAFTDVTAQAGLTTRPDPEHGPLWAVAAAFFDADNDGDLDLFVVNYLAWNYSREPLCEFEAKGEYCHPRYYKGLPNQLFLNQGDGTFRDFSRESGLRAHIGKGMGVGVADFDNDGLPDLFVANDKVFNTFFHNRGGGKFEERAFEIGIALAEHGEMISGMGIDFRDIDNNGAPDIFLVALDLETFPLFRNTGKGEFEEITGPSGLAGLTRKMAGYGPTIADFDNDGWKDLFVTRGHVQSPLMAHRVLIDQPNSVFRNLANGKFAALTAEAGFDALPPSRHRGSAVGDFNEDGKLDAVVVTLAGKAELWLNDSPGAPAWLALELTGRKSNRDGLGARVKLVSKSLTQYSHVAFTQSYASSSAAPLHFGLGPDTTIDLLEITWPSGKVQTLRNLTPNRRLRLSEPD
jgi:hypothetical protein